MANRKESEVKSLLQHANLEEKDLLPETQVLYFTPGFQSEEDNIVLLELDAALLGSLQEGQSAVLRGDPQESAVLCTNNKTFEVRGAVTSNSMLLVPELQVPSRKLGERTLAYREVTSLQHNYLEVLPSKPRFHKLQQLLEECPYRGQEEEEEMEVDQQHNKGQKYCLNELLERIQCSEEELEAGLKTLGAFHIYGFWQIPDFDYLFKIVSHITNLIQEKGWPLDAIPHDEALEELSKHEPRTVMAQCLEYYLQPTHTEREDGDELHVLNGDKVCRLFGEVILRSTSGMELPEFLNMWGLSVPEGLTVSVSQLEGLMLLEKSMSTTVITYFPVAALPLDIRSRFECLFHAQEKWTYEEIRPFLEDLADIKTPVSTLLMKHARGSTINGVKCYSGRYAK